MQPLLLGVWLEFMEVLTLGFVFSGKVRRQSPITLLASSASADEFVICSAIDGCRRRGVTACGLAENVTRSESVTNAESVTSSTVLTQPCSVLRVMEGGEFEGGEQE